MIYRYVKVHKQNRQLNDRLLAAIRPLQEKLESGQAVDQQDVLPYAKDLATRELTFTLLNHFGKRELFPDEYYTLIKGAEGSLANWLRFPTELDAIPDEMEHVKRVTVDFDEEGHKVHYEVFKYRTHEPHWAAKSSWMLGVVGPYFDDSKPYDPVGSTFSRMGNTIDTISPEEEVMWVHKNISLRRK
jgi:hypothetical protein